MADAGKKGSGIINLLHFPSVRQYDGFFKIRKIGKLTLDFEIGGNIARKIKTVAGGPTVAGVDYQIEIRIEIERGTDEGTDNVV